MEYDTHILQLFSSQMIEIFIDEIDSEDFMNLKSTMTAEEVNRFIDAWVESVMKRPEYDFMKDTYETSECEPQFDCIEGKAS